MKKLYIIALLLIILTGAKAQNFETVSATALNGIYFSKQCWADFDNDGYLDIITIGMSGQNSPITKLYKNNLGLSFNIVDNTPFQNVYFGNIGCTDFNNDGLVDILLSGMDLSDNFYTILYKNNGNFSFSVFDNTTFTGVASSSVSWTDFDNDGFTDVIISGTPDNANGITKLYKNNNGINFTLFDGTTFTGVFNGSTIWADFNNDTFADLLINGYSSTGYITHIFINNNGSSFTQLQATNLPQVSTGAASCADYDNDGFIDFAVMGHTNTYYATVNIYKNNGNNTFTNNSNHGIPGYMFGSINWCDYNNDGLSDLLITGNNSNFTASSILYKNIGNGIFTPDNNNNLTGTAGGAAIWADYNNDNKPDILLSGQTENGDAVLQLYKNISTQSNNTPGYPIQLSAQTNQNNVTLSWQNATDTETPANALSYNLYLYNQTTGDTIINPLAIKTSGKLTVVQNGNMQFNKLVTINNLDNGQYVWSVQTIDNGFAASAFAPGQQFAFIIDQNITFNPIVPKQIGDSPFQLLATSSSGLDVSFSSSNNQVATVSGTTVTITGIGSTIITATQPGNNIYNSAQPVQQTLVVNKRLIKVQANNIDKIYAAHDPELTYSIISGSLINNSVFTGNIARAQGENIGAYDIVQNTLALDTTIYNLNFINGVFNINPIPLTIELVGNQKTYGTPDPTFTLNITNGQLLPNDTIKGFISRITGDTTGTYALLPDSLIIPPYYNAQFVAGNLLINKAILNTYAVNDTIYVYNQIPTLKYYFTGFKFTDNQTCIDQLPTLTTNATNASPAGNYAIEIFGATDNNYSFEYNNAQLVIINKLPQTISFDTLPILTYGNAGIKLTATANSGLNVIYTITDTAIATIINDSIIIKTAGTTTIIANQYGNNIYDTAPTVTQKLIINKAPQTIALQIPESIELSSGAINISATTSSGLPVEIIADNNNIALINNLTLTPLQAGSVNITAKQNGNINYLPATPVTKKIVITKPVNVSQINYNQLFTLYPNPAQKSISLNCKLNTLVQIINTNGKVVYYNTLSGFNNINISNIQPGIYFVSFIAQNIQYTQKLIIIN